MNQPLIQDRFELHLQDAMEGMSTLPDKSFDLAICDPPYGSATSANWKYEPSKNKIARSKKSTGFGGNWKLNDQQWDLLTVNEIFRTSYAWLSELQRLVKPTGSIWIHSTYHNAGFVNIVCQLLGLEIINEVVWYKRNAFPNLSGRRLTASHETILWVHTGKENRKDTGKESRKDKRLYTFNYEEVKKARFTGDHFKQAGKQLRTVWDIPNNKAPGEGKFGTHPTQKPIKVSERLLLIAGTRGGKLLVPFAGSGTEMIAGMRYGMHATGFEINEEYFQMACGRILSEETAGKKPASTTPRQ